MMIVYVSIGNSDDKLTQLEWSDFWSDMVRDVVRYAVRVHGSWHSAPAAPYQNACWCLEFETPERAGLAHEAASKLREEYSQESIAWAVAETEFI